MCIYSEKYREREREKQSKNKWIFTYAYYDILAASGRSSAIVQSRRRRPSAFCNLKKEDGLNIVKNKQK